MCYKPTWPLWVRLPNAPSSFIVCTGPEKRILHDADFGFYAFLRMGNDVTSSLWILQRPVGDFLGVMMIVWLIVCTWCYVGCGLQNLLLGSALVHVNKRQSGHESLVQGLGDLPIALKGPSCRPASPVEANLKGPSTPILRCKAPKAILALYYIWDLELPD